MTLPVLNVLMKLEFSRHIFEAYSRIKFLLNPSRGSRVVPCGQTDGPTDRYDEANCRSLHLKFCYTWWDVVLRCVCVFTGLVECVRTDCVIGHTLTERAPCPASGSSPAPPAGTLLIVSPGEPCCSCCTSTEASARFCASSSLMRLCSATISSRRPCT